MRVINNFQVDLSNPQKINRMDAVQGDANSRSIKLELYSNGSTWEVPMEAISSVAFSKADGKSGWYDRLPNGAQACKRLGNSIEATLAPQVLTCPGLVEVSIVVQDKSTLDKIVAFPVYISVVKNPSSQDIISNDYYNYPTVGDMNSAIKKVESGLLSTNQDIKYIKNNVASAIPVTMTGTAVSTDMVSPVEHQVECKVESINILDSKLINTPESWSEWNYGWKVTERIPVIKGKIYTYSIPKLPEDIPGSLTALGLYNGENPPVNPGTESTFLYRSTSSSESKQTFTFVAKENYIRFICNRTTSESPIFTVFPINNVMLQKGNIVTTYTPYIPDLTVVPISRFIGGNIAPSVSHEHENVTKNGVTFTKLSEHSFMLDGVSTAIFSFAFNFDEVKVSYYTIGVGVQAGKDITMTWNGGNSFIDRGEGAVIPADKGHAYLAVNITRSGAVFDHLVVNYGLYQYEGMESFIPGSDGVVNKMDAVSPSMSIFTPNSSVTITATYNADTKKYIDKKFAELQSAIISTGGNV